MEILESGTGHGSLTLHLARAIQAANSNAPPLPERPQLRYLQDRPLRPDEESAKEAENREKKSNEDIDHEDPTQKQWDDWRARRGAIIHTVDVSPKFSAHAETIVRGFRRGIYAGNVDFYVGHVENWIAEQIKHRGVASSASKGLLSSLTYRNTHPDPFLSYAILDMPSAHLRIPHVTPILKRDSILAVFMPSITQIGDCVELIRRNRLPFIQEKVVELGTGLSSGRLWDVRFAMKKSRADPSSWASSSPTETEHISQQSQEQDQDSAPSPEETQPAAEETKTQAQEIPLSQEGKDSVLICRPKVGLRIVGGGFVGIWRRIEDFTAE